MRRMTVATFLVLACMALAGMTLAAPKPADVPNSWELQFTFDKPTMIRVTLPGQKEPSVFWYMTYKVRNGTGADQFYVPDFTLYTNNGQILRSGKGVPALVFDKIKTDLNLPLLKDQAAISGTLLQGLDNAKQGVMIFRDIDPAAGSFDIFAGGLSGETVEVELPNPVPTVKVGTDGNRTVEMKNTVVLSKTLQLHFLLQGEAAQRFQTGANLDSKNGKTWVMR